MTRSFGHGPFSFGLLSPTIKTLVVLNAAIFLMANLVGSQFVELFGLVPARVVGDRWIWQPLTYLFLHGSFLHLLFNLFALWMFGMPVEAQWGSREFLKYYLLCGIGAGLCNLAAAPQSPYPVIGASGAIYGLLVAFAMLYPDAVIYLYFFFPLKAKHFAVFCGLIEFFAGASHATPGVARFAHLSGMLIGYVYIRWWWVMKMGVSAGFRGLGRSRRQAPAPRRSAAAARGGPRPLDMEAEVDRILDKILASGEASLTDEERDILRRQARKGPEGHA